MTRWFKRDPFIPLVEGHKQPLKGSQITIHKKVTSRIARDMTWQLISKQQSLKNSPFHTTPLDLGKSSRSNIVVKPQPFESFGAKDPNRGKTHRNGRLTELLGSKQRICISHCQEHSWPFFAHLPLFLCFFFSDFFVGWLKMCETPPPFFFGTFNGVQGIFWLRYAGVSWLKQTCRYWNWQLMNNPDTELQTNPSLTRMSRNGGEPAVKTCVTNVEMKDANSISTSVFYNTLDSG